MFKSETNLQTGEVTHTDLSAPEVAEALIKTAADNIKQDANRIVTMTGDAEAAELRKLVNVDTGTTPEAIALQAEKARQGI